MIIGTIEYIKSLVKDKNFSLAETTNRQKAKKLPEDKKVADFIWPEVFEESIKTKEGLISKTKIEGKM